MVKTYICIQSTVWLEIFGLNTFQQWQISTENGCDRIKWTKIKIHNQWRKVRNKLTLVCQNKQTYCTELQLNIENYLPLNALKCREPHKSHAMNGFHLLSMIQMSKTYALNASGRKWQQRDWGPACKRSWPERTVDPSGKLSPLCTDFTSGMDWIWE